MLWFGMRRGALRMGLAGLMLLVGGGMNARAEGDFPVSVLTREGWGAAEARLVSDGGEVRLPGALVAVMAGVEHMGAAAGERWAAALAAVGGDSAGARVALVITPEAPVAAGTLISEWSAAIVTGDTAVPDDVTDPAWHELPVPPRQAQPRVLPLPPDARLAGLRLTAQVPRHGGLELPLMRVLPDRQFNASPLATANVESEYTLRPRMGPPRVYAASHLTAGRDQWRNTGPESSDSDVIRRPPVSDVHPSWVVLSWDTARQLEGVILRGNLSEVVFYAYIGPAGLNPSIAPDDQWRRLRARQTFRRDSGRDDSTSERWFAFPSVETRGLKVLIERSDGGPVAWLSALTTVAALTTDAVPAPAEPPPTGVPIPYTIEADGKLTMVVADAAGNRLRNLLARRRRTAGAHAEYWDLTNAQGQLVPPGEYRFEAITHPPLTLRYQMTPYPNVGNHAPGNTPWSTSHAGSGGWLADHTPEGAIATAGDRVYIGAGTAEDGQAMIETDLDGRKLWGRHNFIAWTGPQRMAANAEAVFVHAWSDRAIAGGADHIWRVDRESRRTHELLNRRPQPERARGVTGIAVQDETLLLSVRGNLRWLVNAVSEADVDIENSLPRYPRREARRYSPDHQRDFLRLFRITGTPPGQRLGLEVLTSERGPESRQHILLALRRPVAMGTLVFPMPSIDDVSLRFSTLKPGVDDDPDVEDESQWETIPVETGTTGWSVVPLPPGTETRALRISFIRGEDDAFAEVMDAFPDSGAQRAWSASLEGMKILRRRYRSLLPEARIRANSGTVSASGVWNARRETPITPAAPAIYALTWDDAQPVRGLAIKEIDGKRVEIDVFTGDAGEHIDIEDDTQWHQVSAYTPPRRYFYHPDDNHNPNARYMDSMIDFGSNVVTRAVRLRVVEQWTTREDGRSGMYGVRSDRGGLELSPTRCHVYGVAPLQHLGGDAPEDPLGAQRLELYDARTGDFHRELPLDDGLDLAVGPDGHAYALTGTQVLRLELETGRHHPVVDNLQAPRALTIDGDGHFYVFESAPELQVVRVYDRDGQLRRQLGTPGGFQAGPWDPTRFGNVTAMAADARGQLWAVERQHHPKRTTIWHADGSFRRELLGRTQYGGGGVVDPVSPDLLYYGPLEFEMDPDSGRTRLRNLTWTGRTPAGEQPVYVDGRKYMVTRDRFFRQSVGIVYRYADGVLQLAAAMGLADRFAPLTAPAFRPLLGGKPLSHYQFVWSDLNGDGVVDPDEVQFAPRRIREVTNFDPHLGVTGDGLAFEVERFLPNGVPVYTVRELPFRGSHVYRLNDGGYFEMGQARGRDADGRVRWHYPTEGTGVHAYYRAAPFSPEQVVAEFSIVGHGVAPAGELGEYLVTSSNAGAWHLWTADGLLAGYIFLDQRDPRARRWNMPRQERGMRVENITAGQEHFWGAVTQAADGRTLGVYRSTHVFEIEGMDRFRRLSGVVTVTEQDVRDALEATRREAAQEAYREARVANCPRLDRALVVDGDGGDWEHIRALSMPLPSAFSASLKLAHDATHLYALYEVSGMGPFQNSGEDERQLFKTGAAVDMMLGADPDAPADRRGPVAGDQRLLFAMLEGEPVAMLYEAVVPDAAGASPEHFSTLVFETRFDRIRRLDNAVIAVRERAGGYTVEAAVPLRELGLPPPSGRLIKFDWGVLRSDPEGSAVLGRHYWSNQATGILSDIAAEAALEPNLWGHLRFPVPGEQRAGQPPRPEISLEPAGGGDTALDSMFDALMEELR